MTSAQIRSSFLDFFKSKQHAIVPSSSLMPTAPNLLFTNAGMNQFVPYFLGDQTAPWKRVADTQKCIRAGGKHNDLEDVGFDTYHHTMFEMLGNWSFGDYFKQDSLTWGWELLTKAWGIPPKRLFATVYSPDKQKGDPSDFDQEAYDIWADIFKAAGLDPAVHIVNGNKKDNFWMMGDTGPCGPCSEIHFNLLPSDDEKAGRALVNSSSPRCIEIWNHVFIQFNANADGTFAPLAAKHVDTGMGFERVAGIHATTKGFKDFSAEPSNYNADVFKPTFDEIEQLTAQAGSPKRYTGSVPTERTSLSEQQQVDVAFRVLADHARCVSCAIADGILPGNADRNYVIRRILRRGIMYGRKNLGLKIGFLEQLVAPVVVSLGGVFHELKTQRVMIEKAIRAEEESFGRTLDKGLQIFNKAATDGEISGEAAFELYDTYGFPLDMTQLLAAERGLSTDLDGFEELMEEQRNRGRAARKTDVIVASTEGDAVVDATKFVGYEIDATHATHARLVDVVKTEKDTYLVFDQTPFYGEMGGQVGDTGHALINGVKIDILDTIKDKSGRHLHKIGGPASVPAVGTSATLHVDFNRRRAINRHHSAAHLIHWALRKMLGTHVRQFGTHKTPDRMRFDFTHFEQLTQAQLKECEQLINEKVIDNSPVVSAEIDYDKKPADVLAFFGDKYGKRVRLVDIGGFSKELCGGTHVTTTGEIGVIKIVAEMAIAAGTRRIEAVAGQAALDFIAHEEAALKAVNARLSSGPHDVAAKLESVLNHQKELEKKLKAFEAKASAGLAGELATTAVTKDGLKWVSAIVTAENTEALRSLGSQVLHKVGAGAVVQLGALMDGKVSLVAYCSPEAITAGQSAGKLIGGLAGKLGGKGGGKPDYAQGGGGDATKLADALKL
ncbi:alanine--tRNA ligase [Opitutus sp. GAS368]|jgi:alanyl-tRNA synthetase|uniref:alanine--tRNA ligase n=1 Tax=Opitutus sp. GAS368 TaxID=1882749 RepID=UPI00087C6E4B|nr:alanine--tRNA ligase [Opitutus sp. GAS368]SDS54640.1 alanyl-tRNA synthetase [Opitutus sp. GAS368]